MKPSGLIFYRDNFDIIYHVEWNTVNGIIDLTSTVKQPRVWGKNPEGYVKNGILFRKGIVTVERQVLRPYSGGYEIIAEGAVQYEDFIQMNFPCQDGPQDTFKHHLNNSIVDECEGLVTDGPRWADVDDTTAIWGDIDDSGVPIDDITTVGGADIFSFIDVWS